MIKMKIVYDDNNYTTLTNTGTKTFPEFIADFFKAKYLVLNDNSEVGNMCIDTSKVRYVEVIN